MSQQSALSGKPDSQGFFGAYGGQYVPEPVRARLDELAGAIDSAMGKKRVSAETGAGQHGVATAAGAALMGLECTICMGEVDIERQHLNVIRMEMLGARVLPAKSGQRTLKEAVDEALAVWIDDPEMFYVLGSAVGPHPYPYMVRHFQSVIGREARAQMLEELGRRAGRAARL